MSEVVYLLGAGTSKRAGAPVMNEFLDAARHLWLAGELDDEDDEQAFRRVFKARNDLQRVHSKADINLSNLESVFAAFEMANTLGQFAEYSEEELQVLPDAMRTVIVRTLEERMSFHVEDGQVTPQSPHGDFVQRALEWLPQSAPRDVSTAVLTFNYDIALDLALTDRGIEYNYGLTDDEEGGIPLLKLHGSLNWGYCRGCGEVVPWRLESYLDHHRRGFEIVEDTESVSLLPGSRISWYRHCSEPMDEQPVIVPPTWSKSQYQERVRSVWRRAADELSEAEVLIVVGYSLPETDQFFKHLYALGTAGPRPFRSLTVCDPDEDVRKAFTELLGPGARRRFIFYDQTFHASVTSGITHTLEESFL